MFTRCPQCSAVFRVQPEHLRLAQGRVRCSQCNQIFNALDDLRPTAEAFLESKSAAFGLPKEEGNTPKASLLDPSPILAFEATIDFRPPPPLHPLTAQPPAAEPAPSPSEAQRELEEEIASQLADGTPLPLAQAAPAKRSLAARIGWVLLDLILAAVLLAQAAWWYRDPLLADPRGREALEWACALAGCQIPPRQAPERFEIRHRAVLAHPQIPGLLHIELRFANRAPFPQPHPKLRVILYRADGGIAVRREFQPQEYLPAEARPGLLDSEEELTVRLDVEDPGDEVTGFEFEFR